MASEIDQAIEELLALGLLRRWWCERCQDYVPYRTLEMTEAQSQRKHNRARHPKPVAERSGA